MAACVCVCVCVCVWGVCVCVCVCVGGGGGGGGEEIQHKTLPLLYTNPGILVVYRHFALYE